jgi:hypothetical protein
VEAENFNSLSRLEIAGGGQVVVDGDYAYIGHMDPPFGTSIVDVSDPRAPKVVASIELEGNTSHSHKARVVRSGEIMITNVERARRGWFRRGRLVVAARDALEARLGQAPSNAEIAAEADVDVATVPDLLEAGRVPYDEGGFKVWNIADKAAPKLLTHVKTGGDGSHRFYADDDYAYISSGCEGFVGNILQIYDIGNPAAPELITTWSLPGQNTAAGETPSWHSTDNQLHHAMRCGDELWAGCWHGGLRGIDISDIRNPKTIAEYDYHPAFPHPTHTVMRPSFKPAGRDIVVAIDEEMALRRGQNHAFLWFFELNGGTLKPISTFHVNEGASPYSCSGGRFGAHQYQEHFDGPLLFATWFSGGLRAVDFSDPARPEEVGFFIPDPSAPGKNVQSNDVDVDARGLVYLLDRFGGLDILEFTGPRPA